MRSLLQSGLAFGVGRKTPTVAGQTGSFRFIGLALWTLWALSFASPGAAAQSLSASQLLTASPLRNYGDAIADLDGDGFPDLATVTSKSGGSNTFRYRIELALTSGVGPSSFNVSAEEGGLTIIPRDVDGDGDLDLVIASARSLAPVGVWINDGHGRFTPSDPTAYPRSIWTRGPGISSDNAQRMFPAIAPQSRQSWLDFSKEFHFWSELPIGRLRLGPTTSSLPELALCQPRTRAPPSSLLPQTS
jgi:hypothetical protein